MRSIYDKYCEENARNKRINLLARWLASHNDMLHINYSNGSNGIYASRPFGKNPRMQSVFRYMLPSSHIASLVSSNRTCKSVVPSWKSCESLAALCWLWMMSETCLNHSNERKRSRTTGNSVLTFNTININ